MKKISLILSLSILFAGSLQTVSAVNDTTAKKAKKLVAIEGAPANWFNLDLTNDKVRGISTERAYTELLKDKKSTTIIVAVIDSGTEIDHEDLKDKIWVNEKEIPNNGKDDDNNGYIDDINGWDFIGGKDGKDVSRDSYEVTREYVRLTQKYKGQDTDKLPEKEKVYFKKISTIFEEKSLEAKTQFMGFTMQYDAFKKAENAIKKYLKKDDFTPEEMQAIETEDKDIIKSKQLLARMYTAGLTSKVFEEYKDQMEGAAKYGYNTEFNPRTIVGDDYSNLLEKGYGNNEVEGPAAQHGTHVAGIIGANRKNNIGIKGVADNVKLMILRVVPDGDERDKDIANAIIYATDKGARVVNMSFGKSTSPQKARIDEAVKYAEQKGVLLVHAAGNDAKDVDTEDNYPTKVFLDNKSASNWIEVGASDWGDDKKFVADFSNYGKKIVDVFAPGVDIYATVPNQQYENLSGTSMASPVVAGAAALLLSYFPHLNAIQVKDILLKSSIKYPTTVVNMPGGEGKTVAFGDLSISAGIINVYEAVKLAKKVKAKKTKAGK